jgi:hypothetical protein
MSFVEYHNEKGNRDSTLKSIWPTLKKKGKGHEDIWGLWSFYLTCVLGAPYYQGGRIAWVGEVLIVKK